MAFSISTSIDIAASPAEVWKYLTRLEAFTDWNPFIVEASGELRERSKLVVRISPPGGSAMTFRPIITELREGSSLEWLGSLGVRGIFDGRHRFELEATSYGTRLQQSEEFSGLMVPLLRRSLETKTRAGFVEMNLALKALAEEAVGANT